MTHIRLCDCVLPFHSSALSRWVHPVHQPGEILRFIHSAALSHMLFGTAALTSLEPLILRDCSIFPTCCSHQNCNSLTTPSVNVCVYSVWLMRLGLWGEGSTNMWRSAYPQGLSCDGRLWECLWLQAWVVCQRGGSVSMHLPLHCYTVMTAH